MEKFKYNSSETTEDLEKDKLINSLDQEKYGNIIGFDKYPEGRVNNNYVFESDSGKFFLKKYNEDVVGKIDYIHEVESLMSENNVPAIEAVDVNTELGFSVYPYVEGDRSHEYGSEDYQRMGSSLANIHSITHGKEIPENLKEYSSEEDLDGSKIDDLIKYKEQLHGKVNRDHIDDLFLEYIELKTDLFEKIDLTEDLVTDDTLIHGDFHAGNLIIDEDSREVIGICDWDKSKYGSRLQEVARAYLVIAFGSGEQNNESSLRIGDDFLEGYRAVLPLIDEDFRAGMRARLKSYILNTQLEDSYYKNNSDRMNAFVENRIRILNTLSEYL